MTLHIAPDLDLPLDAATETFGILAKNPDLQLAWAAGLFEGEGCISHDDQARGKRRRLTLVSTDHDVIEVFRATVGAGTVRLRNNGGAAHHKPQWQWSVGRWSEVEPILTALLPFFGERRRSKALALLADPPSRPKAECKRGHALRGPLADVYADGGCAVCARQREQDKRAARRSA